MPGSINQIQNIILTLIVMHHPDGMAFNRDAFFAFQIHTIQNLSDLSSFADNMCLFQKSICQSRFSVINMSHNAEIADKLFFHSISLICIKLNCISVQLKTGFQKYLPCLFVNYPFLWAFLYFVSGLLFHPELYLPTRRTTSCLFSCYGLPNSDSARGCLTTFKKCIF